MKRLPAFLAAHAAVLTALAAPPVQPTGLRFGTSSLVVVGVSPSPVSVATGGQIQFTATVLNASNPAVTWSVVEASGCGSIASDGLYTAPASPVNCRVRAVSVENPGKNGTALVSVRTSVAGGPSGPVGEWEQLTAGLSNHNAGDRIQSIIGDPVNAGHYYLATGNNDARNIKWYRTTDFGDTWTLRNETAMDGNPWGFSIDPNPTRDPSTPPTLYSPAGYGSNGAWKSTDGAATWTRLAGADAAFGPVNKYGVGLTDLYHIQVLPDDPPNHVLATYHYGFKDQPGDEGGFGETWDGGINWVIHMPNAGNGNSHYVIPISATTWCVISQDQSGIWRTTTAGRVGGTPGAKYRDGTISPAAWTKVSSFEHAHGSFGSWRSPAGVWYIAAYQVIAKSVDNGATWQALTGTNWPGTYFGIRATNIVGTGANLYTNFFLDPVQGQAPLSDDGAWVVDFNPVPQVGGSPFGTAVGFAPSIGKYVILMGSGEGELWRYIEP